MVNCVNKRLHNCLLLDTAHVKSIYIVPNWQIVNMKYSNSVFLLNIVNMKYSNAVFLIYNYKCVTFKFQPTLFDINSLIPRVKKERLSSFMSVRGKWARVWLSFPFQTYYNEYKINKKIHHSYTHNRGQQLTLNFIFFVLCIFNGRKIEGSFIR